MPILIGLGLMALFAAMATDWQAEGAVIQFFGMIFIFAIGGGALCWFFFNKVLTY